MTSALAVRDDQQEWSAPQLAALGSMGINKSVPTADLMLFLSYAQRTGLDPFSKQIYLVPRRDGDGTRWTIMAGIDGLRIVAQRTGEYEGRTGPEWFDGTRWLDVWTQDRPPLAARVGVRRRGFVEPLRAVVMWKEYGGTKANWRTMPAHMLAKVAETHALRAAFPHDLSGLYTQDEMDQSERQGHLPSAADVPLPPPPLSVEELVLSVTMARTEGELRQCWQQASAAKALQSDVDSPWSEGQVLTLAELISEARERILNPPAEPVDGVVDGELVESA